MSRRTASSTNRRTSSPLPIAARAFEISAGDLPSLIFGIIFEHQEGCVFSYNREIFSEPYDFGQGRTTISFAIKGIHPHDVGTILDQEGIAIRAGHHCAQPVMKHFGVPATARASFAFYNTKAEVDSLAAAVEKVVEVFG